LSSAYFVLKKYSLKTLVFSGFLQPHAKKDGSKDGMNLKKDGTKILLYFVKNIAVFCKKDGMNLKKRWHKNIAVFCAIHLVAVSIRIILFYFRYLLDH
jgi:hypothetical protein